MSTYCPTSFIAGLAYLNERDSYMAPGRAIYESFIVKVNLMYENTTCLHEGFVRRR